MYLLQFATVVTALAPSHVQNFTDLGLGLRISSNASGSSLPIEPDVSPPSRNSPLETQRPVLICRRGDTTLTPMAPPAYPNRRHHGSRYEPLITPHPCSSSRVEIFVRSRGDDFPAIKWPLEGILSVLI
jgi:hypothetical protein